MIFKRALLPMYAIVAIFAFAPNPTLLVAATLEERVADLEKEKAADIERIAALEKKSQPKPNGKLNFDLKKLTNSPWKIAVVSLLLPFGRLMLKDEPTENPMGFTEGCKGFIANPFTVAYVKHIGKFIDDALIGFKGKKRGFFQVGTSRIGYDGQKSVAKEITRPVADGTATEKVTYHTYGNAYPYGIMGNIYAYFLGTGKANDLKDSIANTEWAHKKIAE